MERLTEDQIEASLSEHAEWSASGGAIQRTYQFDDVAIAREGLEARRVKPRLR